MSEATADKATFTFNVEKALKAEFIQVAKRRDRNASQLLRDFMRGYVDDPSMPASPGAPAPSLATGAPRER